MMIEGNSEIKNVLTADVASSFGENPCSFENKQQSGGKQRSLGLRVVLGKMHGSEEAIKKRNEQVSTLKMCHTFRQWRGLDGDPIDFEWKIFPGATALDILHKIQADLQGQHITPEHFSDRCIFMSMFYDIVLEKKNNEDSCALTSRKITEYASTFNEGHWAFLGPRRRKQVVSRKSNRSWWQVDLRASQTVEDFESSKHPVFEGLSPLGRGILKEKNNRDTIHFNGEYCNIDLLYRIVHSAIQLCIYGAVTKLCGTNSGEASQSRLESAHKISLETQRKQEHLKSVVDIPSLPHASGNRMLQNLKDFNSMPFLSNNECLRTTRNSPSDRERKLLCYNYSCR